ncbi:serine hydroxymethyltransferase [Candidatus Dependentiae bacterium HGW-Dependentiae-1]|nr:MAG: serine hydroxymethyltransferase [Candidatus Dependentiae bacterium HGW-Dependentiae-1]
MKNLHATDPIIESLIHAELEREQKTINLIASENYASHAVMAATGSVLTNKYAEGYPGKRYYAGCEIIDQVETLAIERAKQLFGAEHANVQPHAGSQANMAAYFAVLKPGDTILGMRLSEGGHLTHGHMINFSGTIYKSVQYGVNRDTELLDYDEIERLAQEHKPKLIVAGASAYSRTIDFERFAAIAKSVGALFMADIAHIAGLVAAKVHADPFPHADIVTSTTHKTLRGPRGAFILSKQAHAEALDKAIMPGLQGGPFLHVIAAKAIAFQEALQRDFVSYQKQVVANAQAMATEFVNLGYRIVAGGTDNHLFIIDLRSKNITGLQAQRALAAAGITVSRSCIPFDPQKPWITSGIRIGTPAITTRGMGIWEAKTVVQYVHQALQQHENLQSLAALKGEVEKLCGQFKIC